MGDDISSSIPSTSSAAALLNSVPATIASDALTPITVPRSDESSRSTKTKPMCWYFLKGTCLFGADCRFSHDANGGEVISISRSGSADGKHEAAKPHTFTSTSTSWTPSRNPPPFNSVKKFPSELTNWADAPPFVPESTKLVYTMPEVEAKAISAQKSLAARSNNRMTFAEALGATAGHVPVIRSIKLPLQCPPPGSVYGICPYEGPCPYGPNCIYDLHMQLCKMCDQYCLHPTNLEQRRLHHQKCLQSHEQAMELSFALARSRDKTCGICRENIMEKAGTEKRFGILPNCNHVYCLVCIRKWRQATEFAHKVIRSCPECRIASDFVCPSAFWVETKEQKDKLLRDYRAALGMKDCKYFNKGKGKCPFGNKCFYKHALASGKIVDVGSPRRTRQVHRQNGELANFFDVYLWQFIEDRDYNFLDSILNSSDYSDMEVDPSSDTD